MKSNYGWGIIDNIGRQFNLTLGLTFLLLVSSSFTWGFDNQGYATIQAMDSFLKQFGDQDPKTGVYSIAPKFLSYLNSFQYIGFAFGLIVGSIISDKWGRKRTIFCMSLFSLIASIVTITSKRKEQLLTGRVLNYVYIGMEASTITVFQAEIIPPTARGFAVGAFQFSLGLGGLIIHIITNATSSREDSSAWRIPVGLYFIFPSLIAIAIHFVPESPRWFCLQGKYNESFISLQRYRKGKFSDEEISAEFEEMKATIVSNQLEKGKFMDLFKRKNLRRTLTVVFMDIFRQVTGQAFASQYGVIYIKSLKTVNAFTMTIISSAISVGIVLVALAFADSLGRKKLFYISGFLQAGSLFSMGGLGLATDQDSPIKKGIVAMMMIFSVGYAIGLAPLSYVVSNEIPPINLRDYCNRLGIFFDILFAFIVAFTLPYLLDSEYAGLQSKVGFIYGSFSVLSIIFVFFFVPECKGRTLEEIHIMFERSVPIRDFQKYRIDPIPEDNGEDEKSYEKSEVETEIQRVDSDKEYLK